MTESQAPYSALESKYKHELFIARNIAMDLAERLGEVSMNDLRREAKHKGYLFFENDEAKAWIGAIFKDENFQGTGKHIKADYESAKGRWIQVWRLKSDHQRPVFIQDKQQWKQMEFVA